VCPYSLDQKEHVCCRYGVFKVHADTRARPTETTAPEARSLKTQQRGYYELDVVLGESCHWTADTLEGREMPAINGNAVQQARRLPE
jgi:hypothetical protein